jgi:hypothetical protein
MSEWISAKKALPKRNRLVLVHTGVGEELYYLDKENLWHYESGLVAGMLHPNNLWKERGEK